MADFQFSKKCWDLGREVAFICHDIPNKKSLVCSGHLHPQKDFNKYQHIFADYSRLQIVILNYKGDEKSTFLKFNFKPTEFLSLKAAVDRWLLTRMFGANYEFSYHKQKASNRESNDEFDNFDLTFEYGLQKGPKFKINISNNNRKKYENFFLSEEELEEFFITIEKYIETSYFTFGPPILTKGYKLTEAVIEDYKKNKKGEIETAPASQQFYQPSSQPTYQNYPGNNSPAPPSTQAPAAPPTYPQTPPPQRNNYY